MKNLIIITGNINSGKTNFLFELISFLKKNGIESAGILSPKIIENDVILGYDVLDIQTGLKIKLCRSENSNSQISTPRYGFYQSGIDFGKEILQKSNNDNIEVLIVDEIGKLELQDKVWSDYLTNIFEKFNNTIILTVRKSLVEKVVEKWGLDNYFIINIESEKSEKIIEKIYSLL